MLSTILLGTIFLTIVLYSLKLLYKQIVALYYHKKFDGPPEESVIFGNCSVLQTSPENIFRISREWGKKYYPAYYTRVGHISSVNLLSPEDFELVLTDIHQIKKSPIYDFLHKWLGTGLLTSWGIKWHQRRKILTPAFHFNILQQFIAIFHEQTDRLVEVLRSECDKPATDITNYVTEFTLKTIGETAMGSKIDTTKEMWEKYEKAVRDLGELIIYRVLRPWLKYVILYWFTGAFWSEKKIVKQLHAFTNRVISERRKTFSNDDNIYTYSKSKRLAMLDLLLATQANEGNIDDEGIREEVDTFMFEGHDTTAAAICFALMAIANNCHVQERLFQEMCETLPNLHQKPSFNELQELKYMERTIKEVLRLYPSVPFISRTLGEDMTTHAGHLLPKDSMVHLHVYDIHHNDDIYPDPEKFDPDRFLPENSQNRHPFAYVPFSAGPRNCIGQRFAMLELKSVLCGILANFALEPVDTPENISLITNLILRTTNGIRVKILPRTK